MTDKLLLIDGNYLLNRAMHGPAFKTMSYNGIFTGGVYGFISSLNKVSNEYEDHRPVVFWDGGKSKRRKQLLKRYKKRTAPTGAFHTDDSGNEFTYKDTLNQQQDYLNKILYAMGVPTVKLGGREADDLIGVVSYASLFRKYPHKIVVSKDKDFLHLVTDTTAVLKLGKPDVYVDIDNFEEYTGINSPIWHSLYLAINGDKVDGIDGIKGMGPKTIKKLLSGFPIANNNISVSFVMDCLHNALQQHPKIEKKFAKYHEELQYNGYFTVLRNFHLINLHMEEFNANEVMYIKTLIERDVKYDSESLTQLFNELGMESFLENMYRFRRIYI